MALVYVLLGTNLGDKAENLNTAINYIEEAGFVIIKKSSVYDSSPWGFNHPESFYNQAVCFEIELQPELILSMLLNIEKLMGRERSGENYEARIIDLDILFYDNQIIQSTSLVIPHPLLHLRRFTLVPLCEIAPSFIHPVFNETIQELLEHCPDTGMVQKIKTSLSN
jgi:2-amino-4-hydroxy-6-hydroxymethyldihydropteridine diphosphokinase